MPVHYVQRMKLTRVLRMVISFSALLLFQLSGKALTITNVMPVNVTPSSFTLLWQTLEPATPTISVFSDASGTSNLAGQVGIELFPLHTGNPQITNAYELRQNRATLQEKTKSFGQMQVKVSGCKPGTTYYFRLQATGTNGQQIVFPASGALPSVTTPVENSFVTQSKQLVLDIPGSDMAGRILTLSNTNASYALSAVIGDGAGTNQVFFSLSDLFSQIGGTNFAPIGTHEFTAELLGSGSQNQRQRYAVLFTTGFTVAGSDVQSFAQDSLMVSIGNSVLQTGKAGSISIGAVVSGAVTNVTFALDLATNRFSNVALQTIAPDFAASTLQTVSPGRYQITLRASGGQFLQGTQQNLVQLNFTTVSNQPSAIVQLLPQNFSAARADGSVLSDLFAQQGKIVVIGQEPLLEASFASSQNRALTLYGNPGLSYAIQSSTNLAGNHWEHLVRVPMTNLFQVFAGMDTNQSSVFYRAYEFVADPPLLEATISTNQGRTLMLYGKSGTQYQLQYSTSMSAPMTWHPLVNLALTNSFRSGSVQNVISTNGSIFYRIKVQ